MELLSNKDIKRLFLVLAIILTVFLITGQIIAAVISSDYKQRMFLHDYSIAGYLKMENIDSAIIQKAFTSVKDNDDYQSGRKILQQAGYSSNLKEKLFIDVTAFHDKYAAYLLLLSVFISAALFFAVLSYILRLEKKLSKANEDINTFLNGNTQVRLSQHEEGSLSKLFHSVNSLATSLNSHLVKEKQDREFLKDTISNISHQLKTPLAALRMYNEIIQEEQTENEVIRDFLQSSDRELNRMETLIQNLLILARLDSGTIILNKKRTSLKPFLKELLNDFQIRANNEKKQLCLECDDYMTLSIDEEWMYEAVSNIIKNAFDHTGPEGIITILCQESPVFKEILIKDNGSGIHPQDLAFIFKRFYRSRFSKDKQGTGIGLTLAKMIIEQHDGTIFAESELNKGTTFHLTFPKLTNM
jgi:Signal transduction histidine kinase